jgi:hypothetical protein
VKLGEIRRNSQNLALDFGSRWSAKSFPVTSTGFVFKCHLHTLKETRFQLPEIMAWYHSLSISGMGGIRRNSQKIAESMLGFCALRDENNMW